jgi:hypothetical protein
MQQLGNRFLSSAAKAARGFKKEKPDSKEGEKKKKTQ